MDPAVRYKGRWTSFPNSPEMQSILNDNPDFLEEQAKLVATNIIYATQLEEGGLRGRT